MTRTDPPLPDPAALLQPVAEHLDLYAADADIQREVEAWKAERKLKKRSFREPWRSFSIACGLAFAVGPLVLPPEVLQVSELVTLGLTAAAVYAGIRKRKS